MSAPERPDRTRAAPSLRDYARPTRPPRRDRRSGPTDWSTLMTRRTRTIAIMLTAASLALAGCSASTPAEPDDSAAPTVGETTGATSAPATDESSNEPAADEPTSLMAVVGTEDDPEAYEIELTDESGATITTLPAGDYSLTFVDRSSMHNFHMTGPGDVDVRTDVAGSDESTIEITLVEGTYEYVCDPHVSNMSGSVEVTA